MNARVFLTRHGSTDMNSGSTDVEKFRAWADVPLNDKGIEDAHKAGAYLADKGISHIFASDLGRTMHTAQVISQYTGAEVTPVHGLRPWNIGHFTGQPVEPNKAEVEKFQKDRNRPVPGGESYHEFAERFHTTLYHLTSVSDRTQKPIAVVTHTRDINELKASLKGKKSIPLDSMTPPGGIVRMDVRDGNVKLTDEDPEEGLKTEHKNFQE